MDREWRWSSLCMTKMGKVCGQSRIHTDLYDMTMYNTRFGMQSKTSFPLVSFVCVCIIGKTYISVSTYIYSWTTEK